MKASNKIIDRIKKENIKPIPKWVFISKNILIWLAFLFAIIIGALAFSVILFSIQQTDFDLIAHMSHSGVEYILGLLPFFWIIILVVFIVISIFSVYHSKKGYKLAWSRLVAANVALSILLGSLFFIAGGARKLEKTFAIHVSLYESIEKKKLKIWMMPEEGYLAGFIKNNQDNTLQLVDFDSVSWTIDFKDAFIAPVLSLEKDEQVKLIGTMQSQGHFSAEEIRPWGGPKHRHKTSQGRKK